MKGKKKESTGELDEEVYTQSRYYTSTTPAID